MASVPAPKGGMFIPFSSLTPLLSQVGPFSSWLSCINYVQLWTHRTRGKSRRLETGIELYRRTHRDQRLYLWCLTAPQEEARARIAESRKRKRAAPPAAAPSVAETLRAGRQLFQELEQCIAFFASDEPKSLKALREREALLLR